MLKLRRRIQDASNGPTTYVAASTKIAGTITGQGAYVFCGTVEGDCDIDGVLLIGPDCLWVGDIQADTVIVKGRVEGRIHAHFKLEVRPTARIKGDLSSPLIAVADGAVVQGQVSPDSIVSRFTERRMH